MFDELTPQELRDALAEYRRAEQAQSEPALPQPDAAPPDLTPEQRGTLFESWIAYLDKKDPKSFTAKEREAYRFAVVRALRTV